MSDGDSLKVLSSQYESRATLLVEILKMYVNLLLVFAIAVFACLGLLVKLHEQMAELAAADNSAVPISVRTDEGGIDANLDSEVGVRDASDSFEGATLTQQVLEAALLLSPFFVLAWFAGNLFLRWNYDVVIKEMDCISSILANRMKLSPEEAKDLNHERFLNAYAAPKVFWLLYAIIALPVASVGVLLSLQAGAALPKWDIAYWSFLIVILAGCFGLHLLFRSRIKKL